MYLYKKNVQSLLDAKWIENKDGKITNIKTEKDLCTDTCKVPSYGIKDYIEVVSSGKVMSLKGGETKEGTEVILEDKAAANDKQRWTRSRPTSDGYFTLQNAATVGGDIYLVSTEDGELTNGIFKGPEIPSGTPKGTYYNIYTMIMSKKEASRKHLWK